MFISIYMRLDPLDPLTEMINSGQAFSPAIIFERIIWLMIGFFLLGAILKSIINGMVNQVSITKKSFFHSFNNKKHDEESS